MSNPMEMRERKGLTRIDRRGRREDIFSITCLLASGIAVVILVTLLSTIVARGAGSLNTQFLMGVHLENQPEMSGISQALVGSLVLLLICGAVALPIGIGTAVYLEEFSTSNRWLQRWRGLVQLNINNLAGIPSIVYGILGVTAFVYMFGMFKPIQVNQVPQFEVGANYFYQLKTLELPELDIPGQFVYFPASDPDLAFRTITEPIDVYDRQGLKLKLNVLDPDQPLPNVASQLTTSVMRGTVASRFVRFNRGHFHLPLGRSILAAGLTLALVILPVVIIVSQQAIRSVPDSLRDAALGLGATRWQMVYRTVLPTALPGIMTGAILSMSRAIGEAAPVIAVMGGVLATSRNLATMMDSSPSLPSTIYKWSLHHHIAYDRLAAAAIIVLLVTLLLMNLIAILIRHFYEKRLELL
ncbi:MAG TPA: PstA family ABC transporter permease [Pirellulaceae bacterium]|nr:PstA family ABC transporter permease [Pirellulaceae bacterium]HMO92031.1 PstA family ABC transporter permease [Pirellulaceae bacterium]HMP68830.1 PstA family ABC transporter permease [Pirellulaceae bacterium]